MAGVSRKDLARSLAEKLEIKIVEATPIVDAFFTVLTEALTSTGRVDVRGFGRFVVKNRPARTARNPITGGPVQVAASSTVNFRPSPELKRVVTEGTTVEASA